MKILDIGVLTVDVDLKLRVSYFRTEGGPDPVYCYHDYVNELLKELLDAARKGAPENPCQDVTVSTAELLQMRDGQGRPLVIKTLVHAELQRRGKA